MRTRNRKEVTEGLDAEAAKALAPFVEYLQRNAGELWARAFVTESVKALAVTCKIQDFS